MKFKRVFLIVLDSLGVGEAIDADEYGDGGSNTLKHIIENHSLFIPNLMKLGFTETLALNGNNNVDAYYTIARPINKGKETLTGHYEIVGIRNDKPFKSFKETGFPDDLINEIEIKCGRRVIGNYASSGTEIINVLGEKHIQTGALIIYTSADSVLQVAAHEDIIPIDELYKYCEIIRNITKVDKWKVGRIIARPFIGNKNGSFKRTTNRKDFALDPPSNSVLNYIQNKGLSVISIGKIYDIFNGCGITKKIVAHNNKEAVDKLLNIMDKKFSGLCFANLNDFDSLFGHRRDVVGYANEIESLDVEIPLILNKLNNDDLLIITADHGNDPTFKGSDHTRENVPVIVYSRIFKGSGQLPILESFADIGATIADVFDTEKVLLGKSFLDSLK